MNELERRTIDGRAEFAAAVRLTLQCAAQERVRELILVDSDFSGWPLEDAALLSALSRWARRPLRRMLMLACNFDTLPRQAPRFTAWRRTWAHVVECRSTDIEASQMPTLLLAGSLGLNVLDRVNWRGQWLADDHEIGQWREVVDAVLQRSEGDFPANTLGL